MTYFKGRRETKEWRRTGAELGGGRGGGGGVGVGGRSGFNTAGKISAWDHVSESMPPHPLPTASLLSPSAPSPHFSSIRHHHHHHHYYRTVNRTRYGSRPWSIAALAFTWRVFTWDRKKTRMLPPTCTHSTVHIWSPHTILETHAH